MSHLADYFIRPLSEFYGRNTFGDGFAKRLQPYAESLTPEHLELVATRMIETRRAKGFPSFGECKAALSAADTRMKTPSSVGPKPWERPDHNQEWEAKKRAFQLCRGDLGRQADREGWLLSLLEWVTREQRLPDERQAREIRAWSKRVDDNLHAKPEPWNYRGLCRLRSSMKERAHKDVFGFIEAREAAE